MTRKMCVVILMAGLAVVEGRASAATKVFNVPFGNWGQPTNWVPSGAPIIGDFAYIGAGKTCLIILGDAACDRVTVDSDATNGDGELLIFAEQTLTLYGPTSPGVNTHINGVLTLLGTIAIADTLTIKGGGILYGEGGKIVAAPGASPVLTFEDSEHSGSFNVISTAGLDIDVELVNNAALIAAGGSTVTLSMEDTDGAGIWRATSAGTLIFDACVKGSGTWVLDSPGATIEINAQSTGLTGDVEISAGTLDVNDFFSTCGTLEFSNATIDVAAGKSASFGVTCNPSGACGDT